jgi:hypothetical protein
MEIVQSQARHAVAAFRRESASVYRVAPAVLSRLEADRDGRVSAALQRLKPALPSLIIFYLIQTADLAESRVEIDEYSKRRASEYRKNAEKTRELFQFCEGNISIHLWSVLPKVADELEEAARFAEAQPQKLQINRKLRDEGAGQILAVCHFIKRLLENFNINCFDTRLQKAAQQRLQEAVRWLVEAALSCDFKEPPNRWPEALRKAKAVAGNSSQQ